MAGGFAGRCRKESGKGIKSGDGDRTAAEYKDGKAGMGCDLHTEVGTNGLLLTAHQFVRCVCILHTHVHKYEGAKVF